LSASPSKMPRRSSARPTSAPAHKHGSGTEREGSGRRQSREAVERGEAVRHAGASSRLKPPTPVNKLLHPDRDAARLSVGAGVGYSSADAWDGKGTVLAGLSASRSSREVIYGSGSGQPEHVGGRPWSEVYEAVPPSDMQAVVSAQLGRLDGAGVEGGGRAGAGAGAGSRAVVEGRGGSGVGALKGGGGSGAGAPHLAADGGAEDEKERREQQQQYEAALAALREEHVRRVAELTAAHDKEIEDTKARNFELQKRLEKLESSDVVRAVGKGAKIPAEISQEDREKLEKGLQEQELLIAAYQKENKKLTDECKAAQVCRKRALYKCPVESRAKCLMKVPCRKAYTEAYTRARWKGLYRAL